MLFVSKQVLLYHFSPFKNGPNKHVGLKALSLNSASLVSVGYTRHQSCPPKIGGGYCSKFISFEKSWCRL